MSSLLKLNNENTSMINITKNENKNLICDSSLDINLIHALNSIEFKSSKQFEYSL
jgi:hypothetical protein